MTGLTFNGSAEVRFEGLSRLTDALGGVPMCLDRKVTSIHTNRVFDSGCKRLDGAAALDLLRQRYDLPGGALDRDRNARQFVTSLLDEAGHGQLLTNPVKLHRVIGAAGDAMTFDISRIGVVDLAWQLRDLRGGRLTGAEVPTKPSGAGLTVTAGAEGLYAALRDDNVKAWLTNN
jgi:anionic cell wall polymer biosynthesis LytR-Cps2A-Psr (LCP) family protein